MKVSDPPPAAITITCLADACQALAIAAQEDLPVALINQVDGARSLGVHWIHEVFCQAMATAPRARALGLVDCGDQGGHAMTALALAAHDPRLAVIFKGPADIAIASIAEKRGVRLLLQRPSTFEPANHPNWEAAFRDWLMKD
ncbi:MAG: hypothetical protein AAF530_10880 [Pseudomonadota bacterium]